MKKQDLKKFADETQEEDPESLVSEKDIIDSCPKDLLPQLKKAKAPAARADLLYSVAHNELSEARKRHDAVQKFVSTLNRWFIQQYKDDEQKGITGKMGRIEVKERIVPTVRDWNKLYGYIAKNKAFELLGRRLADKSIAERWEAGKQIPGVDKMTVHKLSVTGVKK